MTGKECEVSIFDLTNPDSCSRSGVGPSVPKAYDSVGVQRFLDKTGKGSVAIGWRNIPRGSPQFLLVF